jgi:hypothetical protein
MDGLAKQQNDRKIDLCRWWQATMHTPTTCLGIILCFLVSGCASKPAVDIQSSPRPAVSYSRPSSQSLEKIKIERISLTEEQLRELSAVARSTTRFDSRWAVEQRPDTMRSGPWTTRIYIFDATGTRQSIRIELRDHASYDIEHSWLNEKMLFVRVCWGRIVSTDFVLDTEAMRFAYIEDAVYSPEESNQR